MTQRTIRLNLTAASFPLLSTNYSASILARQSDDIDYVISNGYTGTQADAFIGIPTFTYMQNVLPTTHGVQSVSYRVEVRGSSGAHFDRAMPLRAGAEQQTVYSPSLGANYFLSDEKVWGANGAGLRQQGSVTKAYVQGRTFIAYENHGIYEWDSALQTFAPVTLEGVTFAGIRGIVGSNNYLILYDDDTIYWSDPYNPLLFIPTAEAGASAGAESVISLRGRIVAALPIHDGFVIYTTTNAVVSMYSGNVIFPWTYREIPGAAGIRTPEHVSHDSNYEAHWAWTTSGLQIIAKQEAKLVFPEVTDFLSQRYIEDYIGKTGKIASRDKEITNYSASSGLDSNFSEGAENLRQRCITSNLEIKLSFIGTRFVVISYGENSLEYALVYDQSLRRWGKLKISHVDVFEWADQNTSFATPLRSFGFLQQDGTILTLDFDICTKDTDAVLLIGTIQHTRARHTTVRGIAVGTTSKHAVDCAVLSSLDGKTYLPEREVLLTESRENFLKWRTRTTAKAHTLKFTGTFNLSSLEVELDIFGTTRA